MAIIAVVLLSLLVSTNALSAGETTALQKIFALKWIPAAACDATYVVCSSGNAEVTELKLKDSAQLAGSLPTELGYLTSLTNMDLGANYISGPIVTQIGLLTALTSLVMARNQITGTVPTELINLKNLKSLDLTENRLKGELPDSFASMAVTDCSIGGQQGSRVYTCTTKLESSDFGVTCGLTCSQCPGEVVAGKGIGTCLSVMSGSNCSATCDSGTIYPAAAYCLSGVLSAQQCEPDCTGTAPANGAIGTCAKVASRSKCSVTCSKGYSVSPANATCGFIGSSTTTTLSSQTCIPDCPSPAAPENGDIGTCAGVLRSGSTCSVACNDGFTTAPAIASCSNGILTKQSCIENGCTRSIPLNGEMGTCSAVKPGFNCSILCDSGYTASPSFTTCIGGSMASQQCIANDCKGVAPTNGEVGECAQVKSGASCSIQCNTGFNVQPANATCLAGYLTPQTCVGAVLIDCVGKSPENGDVGTCLLAKDGTNCSAVCDAPYVITPAVATCIGGEVTPQTCVEPPCLGAAPSYGGIGTCARVEPGGNCSRTCSSGYTLSPANATCSLGVLTAQRCTAIPKPPASQSTAAAFSGGILGALTIGVLAVAVAAFA